MSTNTWDPKGYAQHAAFVPAMAEDLLGWLQPKAGMRVLDLGCGDGILTQKIVAAGAEVVGVDGSAAMVAAACGLGLDARVMDGESLAFEQEFDAVFSNAAMHWMKRPELVVAGVRRALRPGGRFVSEFGGHLNVAAICTAIRAVLRARGIDPEPAFPWYYPDPAAYTQLLQTHGFVVERMHHFPRPTPLPTGMRGWLETFARPWMRDLPEADRETALDEAAELLRPALMDSQGKWTADYFRLRFVAILTV